MKAIDFYCITKKMLEKLADLHGVQNLKKYYYLTDYQNECFSTMNGIPQVMALMAFHATNATMIANIVKFKNNYDFLKETLFDFSPKKIVHIIGIRVFF